MILTYYQGCREVGKELGVFMFNKGVNADFQIVIYGEGYKGIEWIGSEIDKQFKGEVIDMILERYSNIIELTSYDKNKNIIDSIFLNNYNMVKITQVKNA